MIYQESKAYITDKDKVTHAICEDAFSKTLRMFTYSGLPSSIPAFELEKRLQKHGWVFVFKHTDGLLYAVCGALSGLDVYHNPTTITIINAALELNETKPLSDGVLIENDALRRGILPLIGMYAAAICDANISLNNAIVWGRISNVIVADNDRSAQSATKYLENIENGLNSIITENAFMKGVTLQQASNTHAHITPLIEALQYYKGSLLNALGLNANYNMKRDRLNTDEVALNVDQLLPLPDHMFYCRREAIEKINSKFGTSISIDLNSAWKLEKENVDKGVDMLETKTTEDVTYDTASVAN